MVEAAADVVVPVSPEAAFAVVTDLAKADWLPAIRGLRHVGGPPRGVGARYEVEVGLIGRHLEGILVCREESPPRTFVLELEDGLDLTVTVTVTELGGGCRVAISARYSIPGPLGKAAERASIGVARREAARAVETLAARFGRKAPLPEVRPRRASRSSRSGRA